MMWICTIESNQWCEYGLVARAGVPFEAFNQLNRVSVSSGDQVFHHSVRPPDISTGDGVHLHVQFHQPSYVLNEGSTGNFSMEVVMESPLDQGVPGV